jgi:hypothetical protein
VGEIVQVEPGSATTASEIFVRPSAGINSMQEVGVLLYEPPEPAEFEQTLPNAVRKK